MMRALVIAALVLVVYGGTVSAQMEMLKQMRKLPRIERFGFDGFQLMLQQRGLSTAQETAGTALEQSDRTVCVVLGDMTSVWPIMHQLTDFVDRGGVLLVATDLIGKSAGAPVRGIDLQLGPHVGDPEGRHYDVKDLLQGLSDCPIVSRFENDGQSLFRGVSMIATNRPASLSVVGRAITLAWLPPMLSNQSAAPFIAMVRGRRNVGRILVIADHSLLTNEMLMFGNNARFANNLAAWLCQDGRENLLLISDGDVLPAWGLGRTPPRIPLDALLRAVSKGDWSQLPLEDHSLLPLLNESIGSYQRGHGFNDFLHACSQRLSYWLGWGNYVLLFFTALFSVVGFWSLGKVRWLAEGWNSSQDWRHVYERQSAHDVRSRRFEPGLRLLARDVMRELGATTFESTTPPTIAPQPRVMPDSVHSDLRLAWQLAVGKARGGWGKKRFRATLQQLEQLRGLHQSGQLRVEWPT